MNDYTTVHNALQDCDTEHSLASAWAMNQERIKKLPEAHRNALIHMKDYYKKMMQQGTIHDYLAARAKVREEFNKKG